MKVLDVQEVMNAIDKIKISKQQDSDNIESLRASIQKIEQLETLQGKGGEALKDHFRRLHLPVLEAFHLLIRQYMEQLDRVKSNLLGFESSSAIVREEFLSGELKNGLDRIATTATEDANEIESIRTSISDILPLTPFSMEEVLRQVDRGKDHAKETIETLHALDEQNEALLAQAESTLREVTNVVSQVANWSSGGAILSAETLAEVDANVEALYANLVTEAIQMTPPDPFDLTGHESVMYQTALPLEFLYTGAYANIPGGLKAMSWYYMNQFPVSAMMNDEQAIQACVAPPIEQDVDEGGGWLNATFNFFKGVGSGAVNAVGDAVEGVVNLVTDPIGVYNNTVEFIGAIVDDPALVGEIATELWNAFEDDVINGDAQSRGEWTGYALGLIGTAVVGDKGVSKVANSGQLAKLGRIGGKDGYKTRHEIELRLATQTPPTRPSLRTSMSNTRTRGVQALNTYAQNMKMSATIATGQASLAVKGATGQVKNSLARGMDNLQTNLNGSTPALAPAGGTGNRVPYNAMDSRRIQQDVGAGKQEQLRKIEVGSGVNHYTRVDGKKALKPNISYTTQNGYRYKTDSEGRIKSVEANLQLGLAKRNTYAQRKVGGVDRLSGDDGGHLIASIFKGSGDIDNLVPMNANLNRSEYKMLENTWKKALEAGKEVSVSVKPIYSASNKRPDEFRINYIIDGRKESEILTNYTS
ncbi:T7SS effector LXG polymorphic toxin [Shouchella lehensis]|uniref:LXG domain-containing protein n=1 Tax=Shouchella lehensis TaxID=300825 RepID=A0A4Y7WM64_9BACI|nr:T7SS effector LXG polymorphic toxin [Shouchella lehensis]TES49590.1 hypothetical protein E2L03_08985 [Shouchella lehensis]